MASVGFISSAIEPVMLLMKLLKAGTCNIARLVFNVVKVDIKCYVLLHVVLGAVKSSQKHLAVSIHGF